MPGDEQDTPAPRQSFAKKPKKIEKARPALKNSKPDKGAHFVWKFFKVYVSSRYTCVAVCQLCVANDNPQSA